MPCIAALAPPAGSILEARLRSSDTTHLSLQEQKQIYIYIYICIEPSEGDLAAWDNLVTIAHVLSDGDTICYVLFHERERERERRQHGKMCVMK